MGTSCYCSYPLWYLIFISSSIWALAQNAALDPCPEKSTNCKTCTETTFSPDNKTCVFYLKKEFVPSKNSSSRGGYTIVVEPECSQAASLTEDISEIAHTATECAAIPPIPTSSVSPIVTTTLPTPVETSTSSTTTTTIVPSPTTSVPATSSPTASDPLPTPSPEASGGMSVGSIFGVLTLTLGLSAVGYMTWRFYKGRMDRNYGSI